MHRLDRPAALDKPPGQEIQQFRMRRRFPSLSEVVWCADQAGSKVDLPDAVHHHTGSEWVVWTAHPFRKLQSATSKNNGRLSFTGNDLQKTPRNFIPQILVVAANVNAHILRIVIAADHSENGLRYRLLRCRPFLLKLDDTARFKLRKESYQVFQFSSWFQSFRQPSAMTIVCRFTLTRLPENLLV